MEDLAFVDREQRLAEERLGKYVGAARIRLASLAYQHEVDDENVQRLAELLQASRCDRTDTANHATAMIDQHVLDEALALSDVTFEQVAHGKAHGYPELCLPYGQQLQCLHGADRLAAAEQVLFSDDRYWVVDLYLADMSADLRLALVDAYGSEKIPSDGEFYTKIRQYQRDGNLFFQELWLSRLAAVSPQKCKNLRRLLKLPDYLSAFDCQLDMPGLSKSMMLGTIHSMLAMRCDEENIRYLNYVKDTWSNIMSHDEQTMQKLDGGTVSALELTAPGFCPREDADLYCKLLDGRVLKHFDSRERVKIWTNVLTVSKDRLIPSLRSFFEDIRYLEGPAELIKRLIPTHSRAGLTTMMTRMYAGVRQVPAACHVQMSAIGLETRETDLADRISTACAELWIAAMRESRKVTVGRTKNVMDRVAIGEYNRDSICRIARLASSLGFRSAQISELCKQLPDREIARRALETARDPALYRYPVAEMETYIDRMVEIFDAASKIEAETDIGDPAIKYRFIRDRKRCGLPKLCDHREDQNMLSLENVHGSVDGTGEVDSFFVRRSVFLSFFGKLGSIRSRLKAQGKQHAREETNNVMEMDQLMSRERARPASRVPGETQCKEGLLDREAGGRVSEQDGETSTKTVSVPNDTGLHRGPEEKEKPIWKDITVLQEAIAQQAKSTCAGGIGAFDPNPDKGFPFAQSTIFQFGQSGEPKKKEDCSEENEVEEDVQLAIAGTMNDKVVQRRPRHAKQNGVTKNTKSTQRRNGPVIKKSNAPVQGSTVRPVHCGSERLQGGHDVRKIDREAQQCEEETAAELEPEQEAPQTPDPEPVSTTEMNQEREPLTVTAEQTESREDPTTAVVSRASVLTACDPGVAGAEDQKCAPSKEVHNLDIQQEQSRTQPTGPKAEEQVQIQLDQQPISVPGQDSNDEFKQVTIEPTMHRSTAAKSLPLQGLALRTAWLPMHESCDAADKAPTPFQPQRPASPDQPLSCPRTNPINEKQVLDGRGGRHRRRGRIITSYAARTRYPYDLRSRPRSRVFSSCAQEQLTDNLENSALGYHDVDGSSPPMPKEASVVEDIVGTDQVEPEFRQDSPKQSESWPDLVHESESGLDGTEPSHEERRTAETRSIETPCLDKTCAHIGHGEVDECTEKGIPVEYDQRRALAEECYGQHDADQRSAPCQMEDRVQRCVQAVTAEPKAGQDEPPTTNLDTVSAAEADQKLGPSTGISKRIEHEEEVAVAAAVLASASTSSNAGVHGVEYVNSAVERDLQDLDVQPKQDLVQPTEPEMREPAQEELDQAFASGRSRDSRKGSAQLDKSSPLESPYVCKGASNTPSKETVRIEVREKIGDAWMPLETISVTHNATGNPIWDATRLIIKRTRKYSGYRIEHSDGTPMTEQECVTKVIKDGTLAMYLVPLSNIPFAPGKRPRLEAYDYDTKVR